MLNRIWTLLIGMAVVVSANGFLTTIVGVRASASGFSALATGLIMSGYFGGFLLGTFAGPALVRQVGHIRAFAAMAAIASVAGLMHTIAADPILWGVLRTIGGFCVVVLFMVVESWLNVVSTNENRGRVFFAYNQVSLLCLGLTQLLLLVGADGGDQPFLLIAGLLSLALIPIALTSVRQPRRIRKINVDLPALWRTSPLGVAGTAVAALTTATVLSMGPVYAQQSGFDTSQIAVFMTVAILGGGLLQIPIGRFSDLIDRRKVLLMVSLGGGGLAAAGLVLEGYGLPLLVAMFVLGGAVFSLYPLAVAHTNDHVPQDQMLATSSGLLMVYAVGAIVSPMLVGTVMQMIGPRGMFMSIGAGMLALTMFGLSRTVMTPPVEPADQDAFVPMMRTSQAELEMYPDAVEEAAPSEEAPPPGS